MHKKIVHIVLTRPDPLGAGADIRNLAVHRALAEQGKAVLVAVDDFLPEPGLYPQRKPSGIEADLPASTVHGVVEKVQSLMPDLIVLDGVFLADVAQALSVAGHGYVLDMHNVESDLCRQIDRARRGLWAHVRYRRRWQAARRAEAAVVTGAMRVMVCSDKDGQRAATLAGRAISYHVVPNPVPAWCRDGRVPDLSSDHGCRILFVGHLGYAPNIRAAHRLLTRILPVIARAVPDVSLEICGRRPNTKLRALVDVTPNAALHADLADLAPHYAAATVAVIPLTEGGGTRLKVLEALSVGLPVVASAKAVEGIGLVPGLHYLEARSDADFVRATLRVVQEAGLAATLVSNGKAFVEEKFSTAAIGRAVAAAISVPLDLVTPEPPALDAALPARNSRPGHIAAEG
ncbi:MULTISPECIES: glycosyltransferase family 4 protein [unclassified Yoonia]|uniref:glycosyltransferase family 4 protein n=1 Tax=unclassified Yoonia TaxID=2629118 RepID=UPI002AFF0948|nr:MULTISPECIES: glycosyltransferase family 4 protein [unclassified Yoonia]